MTSSTHGDSGSRRASVALRSMATILAMLGVVCAAATLGPAGLIGPAPALAAQDLPPETEEFGRLLGLVREGETGPAVPGARVTLRGPEERSAVTGESGEFRMELLPPGLYRVEVEHLAYRRIEVEVEVAGGEQTTRVELRLMRDAIAIDPVTVEVEARRGTGPLVGVYDRVARQQALGLGRIFTRDEFEHRGTSRVSSLLQTMPSVRVNSRGNVTLRARGSVSQRTCNPEVWLDGFRVGRSDDAVNIDDFVTVSQLEVMEVYTGPSQIPFEFLSSDSMCGVIVLWTRRGG
ncbi:MAG: hypothetical protein EA351_12905 [Gemmatimonadales bacterium]|nr:MAG: hypothetical protein EA351_12905 [Gemmatimonadales bacterium]